MGFLVTFLISAMGAINEIVSEELEKVSNKSSVCLFSDNESSDSASIKEEGISPDDPGVEDATLSAINEIVSEELEKVSNKSSVSLFSDNESSDSASIKEEENSPADPGVEASPENLTGLVCHVKFISSPEIEEIVSQTDLDGLFTQNQPNGKYIWLTNYQTEYRFGRKTYHPHNFDLCYGVKSILDKINDKHGLELNSCLLVRYSSDNTALSLHQDNEEILDESHPIVITSVGPARTLQFWDADSESKGKLIKEVTPSQGDLLLMKAGCQSKLWHKVLHNQTPQPNTVKPRYALSFRKIKSLYAVPQKSESDATSIQASSPRPNLLKPLPNGFLVHPDRASPVTQSARNNHVSNKPLNKHLIIGDSMVNGLNVSGSICIYRGGIRPHEILSLLPSSIDILHPNNYSNISSVTVVVGTNALNVNRPNSGMPLLDVVEDYEKLIHDLRKLFPRARLGLYNILPRAFRCHETRERIQIFNTIFDQHVAPRITGVFWIRHFWEFLDEWGHLRKDLYGKLGLHLKPKGKNMMASAIKNFQHAYK